MKTVSTYEMNVWMILNPDNDNPHPRDWHLPHYYLDINIRDQLSEHIYTEHEED